MPTYQYRCAKGHSFEAFQKISERPKAKCPACGAKAARVITGGAGLIFKGSGFYITDYGKDGKGAKKETTSDAGAPSAAPEQAAKPNAPKPAPTTEKAKRASGKPAE
jgi:putative FmdB family regulatory protein